MPSRTPERLAHGRFTPAEEAALYTMANIVFPNGAPRGPISPEEARAAAARAGYVRMDDFWLEEAEVETPLDIGWMVGGIIDHTLLPGCTPTAATGDQGHLQAPGTATPTSARSASSADTMDGEEGDDEAEGPTSAQPRESSACQRCWRRFKRSVVSANRRVLRCLGARGTQRASTPVTTMTTSQSL